MNCILMLFLLNWQMEKMEKRIIESITITAGSIATKALSIRAIRVRIKIFPSIILGWLLITSHLKTPTAAKKEFTQKFNEIYTFLY